MKLVDVLIIPVFNVLHECYTVGDDVFMFFIVFVKMMVLVQSIINMFGDNVDMF